jgi:hypothetical protein
LIHHLAEERSLGQRLLFTRQERTVHGVLPDAVVAAYVRWVVQPVRSCRAEWPQVE